MLRFNPKSGLLFTNASIISQKELLCEELELVADLGAVLTIVDTSIMSYLGYTVTDAVRKSSLDGAGGRSEGFIVCVKSFKCLGFELNNFEIACHDMNSKLGVAGLLGMNFLKWFRMDVDFSSGLIHKIEKVAKLS